MIQRAVIFGFGAHTLSDAFEPCFGIKRTVLCHRRETAFA